MKKTCVKIIAVAGLVFAMRAAVAEETPKGWFHAGSHPRDYEMVIDRSEVHGGKASASLKSIAPETKGFGTLMQTFKADKFRGKRVRMSGYVRSKDVNDWAALWLRVDGSKGELLAFDNMQGRPIKGTSDWTRYEIVLDVPEDAQEIAFGLLLTGKGQAWMDDLNFEAVGKEVPTTAENPMKKAPSGPVNLNFEE
jgi:hypothetical protein